MLYRQIILEWGQDTESGVWGLGYSPDNGKNFYVLNTTHGRKYRAEDGNRLYPYISDQVQDKIDTVVGPAKSAADSAQSAADAAVASAQVTSAAVSAIASATAEAKAGANDAIIRAKSAWDVATGAKEAVTDFDPLLKSAQSDAGKALSQIADTASALSDAKTVFTSDVAETKKLANNAQTTADSAVKSAGENAKALTSQANALSDARKAMDSDIANAKELANAAQTTADSAVESASSVANDLAAVASQAKANANGITKVTSDVGSLQTKVADNSGNISTIQETAKQIQQAVSDNSGAIVVATQTAQGAATVASDAKSNATVAVQTASGASVTAKNAQGDATTAMVTAKGAVTQASDAKSNATIAVQTASEASLTATNAQGDASIAKQTASGASLTAINANNDATVAKQTASEAKVQASNAESDFAQISIRANKIEANVANNSGAIASVQQTANGLTTTVADIKANGGGRNLWIGSKSFANTNVNSPEVDWNTDSGGVVTAHMTGIAGFYGKWQYIYANSTDPFAIGDPATFSIEMKGSGTITIGREGDFQKAVTLTGNWTRYAVSGTVNSTNRAHIIYNESGKDCDAYVRLPMVEKGTVAHDWSPASEDLQNQFTQTKESIDGITTTINDPKTGLNATYQTAAGNATTISNVKSDVYQLETTANGLTSRVGNLESKTNTQETAIEQKKQAIALKADQTDVDKINGTVSQLQSSLTVQAGQIQEKVTSSQVTGMLAGYATQDYAQGLVTLKADEWNVNLTKLKNDTQNSVASLSATVDGIKGLVETKAGQSEVTQLSNLVQSKVSSGDFASTTTQLKNMINQRVQVGDVISQINQEAGGDTLIQVSNGKKSLILDAGNTIFTGKAWIPSAAIANLTADDITTGTLKGVKVDFRDSTGTGMIADGSTLTFDVSNTPAGYLSYNGMPVAELPDGSGGNELAIRYGLSTAIIPDDNSGAQATFSKAAQKIAYMTGTNRGKQMLSGLEVHSNNHHWLCAVNSDATCNRFEVNDRDGLNIAWHDNTHFFISDGNARLYKDNDDSSTATKLEIHGWAWVNGWVEAAGHSQHSTLSSKTRIEEADPNHMLDLVNNTELTTFAFKSEVAEGTEARHIGPIIDDVNDVAQYRMPAEFIAPTKTARDDDNMIGALFGAVQALTKRIKALEEKTK